MEEARVVAADDQVKEPMSPGARLLQAPSMDSYVIATMGSKKIIDIDVIREGLKQTLIKHPRFSSKLRPDILAKREPDTTVLWHRASSQVTRKSSR
ncbi:hypothetical protein Dimus_028179 [Dionaea muscipula]